MDELKYRRDIDGLRAISVLAVILYHYDLSAAGGFIGVDCFFVISGYLITSIIVKQLNNGQFSFLEFYVRRIRRILPAVIFVILATLLSGYFILLPSMYAKLGDSALYAAFGASNFYFFWHTGYFDTVSEFHPLLHTWSLAVEEQFYLLWPLLLLSVTRFTKGRASFTLAALGLVLVISLVISIYTVSVDQKHAFYMLESRAWELSLGGLLAFLPAVTNRVVSSVLSVAGLLLVGLSITYLNPEMKFPGANALYPCVGAALLILPKRENFVSAFLSLPPLVFVGKISYSLYLWHWPVLVFYRHYGTGKMPTTNEKIVLIFICVFLSIFTWRYIEQRFRRMKSTRKSFTVYIGASTALLTAMAGFSISYAAGIPQRLPETLRKVEQLVNETVTSQNGFGSCFISSLSVNGAKDFSNKDCISTVPGRRNAILIGDSHAAHFAKALRTLYPEVHFSQVTSSGCTPILHAKGRSPCHVLMRRAVDEAIPSGRFDTVIFSARWRKEHSKDFKRVIEWTKQYVDDIVVLGPTIEYAKPLPTLLAKSALRHDGGKLIDEARLYSDAKQQARYLYAWIKERNVRYFSVIEALCPKQNCLTIDQSGMPLQFDGGHFTYSGALFVINSLKNKGFL